MGKVSVDRNAAAETQTLKKAPGKVGNKAENRQKLRDPRKGFCIKALTGQNPSQGNGFCQQKRCTETQTKKIGAEKVGNKVGNQPKSTETRGIQPPLGGRKRVSVSAPLPYPPHLGRQRPKPKTS